MFGRKTGAQHATQAMTDQFRFVDLARADQLQQLSIGQVQQTVLPGRRWHPLCARQRQDIDHVAFVEMRDDAAPHCRFGSTVQLGRVGTNTMPETEAFRGLFDQHAPAIAGTGAKSHGAAHEDSRLLRVD